MSAPAQARAPEGAALALQKWRAVVTDRLLLLFAVASVPVLGVWLLQHDAPVWENQRLPVASIYALVLAAAGVRRLPPAVRVWLMLTALQLMAAVGLIAYRGSLSHVWLLATPILALILVGPRSGWAAALLSTVLILSHAAATALGLAKTWRVPGFDDSRPSVIVFMAIVWLGILAVLMFLLQRLQHLEIQTLEAERAASVRLGEEQQALLREVAQRQHLEREIARVGDEERRRLGHDLHDGVSQQLAGALLRCAALEERLSHEESAGVDDARALGALLESALEESQEVARGLSPVDMHPDALGPALQALSRRAGASFRVRCEYRAEGEAGLRDRESTLHLYRIAQEAVNNAGKHARASRITIALAGSEDGVLLKVEDDGRGLPASTSGGLGLRIMDYRARLIGATLAIERPPQGGTRVVCRVPRGASIDH